jgi:hypothetical protein
MSRLAARTALALVLCGTSAGPAFAQAWTPPAGVGSVSLVYQQIHNTGHRLTDGLLIPDGKSVTMAMQVSVDYAFTDRWSLSASIPYVFAKYIGPNPPPFGYLAVDECKCWQQGAQDFGLTARFNAVSGPLAVTPSITVGVPSHNYNYQGEAVVGRNLKEVQIGVDAGARLDMVWDRLVVQGRYHYGIVEQVLGIPNNRSNAGIDGTILLSRRSSVRGFVSWQRTHGGLRAGSLPPYDLPFPGEINTPDRVDQHDRVIRDNRWHVGAGASHAFPMMDVFGSYVEFVRGTDTHAGRSFTVGVSLPFEWH